MNREQSFNAELDSGRQLQKQNESLDQWAKFYNTHEDDYIFTMEQLPAALQMMERDERREREELE